MHIVAIVSQKGGSGKTTLTGHLSVQAELSGHGPVAVIDTDPQGSLAAWWNERAAQAPVFVQTTLQDLRKHLGNLNQAGVKTVLIDTPPAITGAIHEVISVADYVVVPTKPSPHDLRAVGATVKLVEACKKPMVFVLNDASPRAKITFEAAIALSQHGTVAPVTVHHRTLFASAMIDGRTAQELEPNGQSAIEILGLWEYVHARLNAQILPTAIGLNAMHRHDGEAGDKKPFVLSSEFVEQHIENHDDDEAPEFNVPKQEPQTPSLANVESQQQSIAAKTPAKETGTQENTKKDQDLWRGFASADDDPMSHTPSRDTVETGSPGTQRVFGSRHIRQTF